LPELPEVETIRRAFAANFIGRTITRADLLLPKLFREGNSLDLVGKKVLRVRRHAKFLITDFEDDWSLILHFNLAGQIAIDLVGGDRVFNGGHPVPAYGTPLPHRTTRLIVEFDNGTTLFLTDIRSFSNAWLLPTPLADDFLRTKERGPDALEANLTDEEFLARLKKRGGTALKALLLDQHFLAGIGNIYADESMWAAYLHPLRTAGSLSLVEAHNLRVSIHDVLDYAITNGVAEVLNGKAISDTDFPRVHGRQGLPCYRCGTPIQRIRVTQRSTYFCPSCQSKDDASGGNPKHRLNQKADTKNN